MTDFEQEQELVLLMWILHISEGNCSPYELQRQGRGELQEVVCLRVRVFARQVKFGTYVSKRTTHAEQAAVAAGT